MGKIQWKPGNMIYPLPAVMVSCAEEGKNDNIITVAWTGTVCTNPPMAYISVRPDRYSYDMIKDTGKFVVNIPGKDFADEFNYLGTVSGRDEDKLAEINTVDGDIVDAPILTDCPVNFECAVVTSL